LAKLGLRDDTRRRRDQQDQHVKRLWRQVQRDATPHQRPLRAVGGEVAEAGDRGLPREFPRISQIGAVTPAMDSRPITASLPGCG
jgi:hypothetical protein